MLRFLIVLLVVSSHGSAFAQRGPALVEVTPIERRDMSPSQSMLGTVMPTRRAVIGSAVDGRVEEFLVREGDRVENGQELAKLLTATISLELVAAEAELKLRERELAELNNGSLPEEITQAKARLEASQVVAEYLQKDKQRLAALGERSAISVSEFEDSVSLWLAAQQRSIEAQAAYQLALNGPRLEKIEQAEARVEMQKAVVDKLRDQIAKHTMYSRFDGFVTKELTEVGQWLPRGDPVAEIIAIDEVDVVVKVAESYIPFIKVIQEEDLEGQEVEVAIPALGRTLPGRVVAIIPEADERSRTFPVKVRMTNEITDGIPLLKAGMLARVSLPTSDARSVLAVPKDALVLAGQSTMIWTVQKPVNAETEGMLEGDAIAVPVEKGIESGALIEVIGDVTPGMNVVIRGNERLPPPRPGSPPPRVTWKLEKPAQAAE